MLDGLIWWGFVPVDSGIYYFDRPAAHLEGEQVLDVRAEATGDQGLG